MNGSGVRRWLIACDESGIHGSPHYGFGSLWMQWQRRGDFYRDFNDLANKHHFENECKWSQAQKKYLGFYEELITYFFERRWLVFHCLVVRKEGVRKEIYHDNDWDLARRKHYTMLLTDKMKKALRKFPKREHEFRVYVDSIASRYSKADEAMEVISNNVLNKDFGRASPVSSVLTRDSKDTPAIQLCDLLLGAVMETWQQKSTSSTHNAIRNSIARYLGWKDLDSDTMPNERKFNVWYFFDPPREGRKVKTRKVELLHPYP
jgi:hypothetical protein